MESAVDFLKQAEKTMLERGRTYDKNKKNGDQERSMLATVIAFHAITGKHLNEEEGWLFMLLLKQVRQWSTGEYHEDSALDSVAYSSLLAEALKKNASEESN